MCVWGVQMLLGPEAAAGICGGLGGLFSALLYAVPEHRPTDACPARCALLPPADADLCCSGWGARPHRRLPRSLCPPAARRR